MYVCVYIYYIVICMASFSNANYAIQLYQNLKEFSLTFQWWVLFKVL